MRTKKVKSKMIGENVYIMWILGFPGGASGKEPTCQCKRHKRHGFNP